MTEIYAYRARNSDGDLVTGFVEANSQEAAANQLSSYGYYIIDVYPAPVYKQRLNCRFWKLKVGSMDLALYCRQLATMVNSGVPILSCLSVLQSQSTNKKLAGVSSRLIKHLEEGRTLTNAVQQFPHIFPGLFVGMIKAGELSGSLVESLERLALHFEKQYEIKERIKAAISYPVIVTIISFLAIAVFLTFVLPKVNHLLLREDLNLPLTTRIVFTISECLSTHWHTVLLTFILISLAFNWLARTRKGKLIIDRVLISAPVVGNLILKIIICRFCQTLSTLEKSGIPILQSMDIVKGTITNSFVTRVVDNVKKDVSSGISIAESLANNKIFPPMVVQMIKVGENSGELDLLLEQVASYYEREVNYGLSNLIKLIEPLLILLIGCMVGIIVSAVFLPLLQTIGTVY